ncbi:MAG: phosphoribosylformimino-5-aminoimidazole carboxamide ribotide isomerase [Myxococcota bacterium]
MRFRPCIDLHGGLVKQIVGSTLREGDTPETNFSTNVSASHFAELFRQDGLDGGHVIMLGPGNERAAESALQAFPGGLQIGGGITPNNAAAWLERGAAAVIATSYLFENGAFSWARLAALQTEVGRDRLVVDLSCAPSGDRYVVMADRWQTETDLEVGSESLGALESHCCEFLIHAVAVEGKQAGPDPTLIERLAGSPLPTTYAGGIRSLGDIERIETLSGGRLDFTVGSALDLFGGNLHYRDLTRYAGCRKDQR